MIMYVLYRIAQTVVLILPLRFSYWLASRVADVRYYTSPRDRRLLANNLKTALGKEGSEARRLGREILRNFGKYLVEFLRFSRMEKGYIEKFVVFEGRENL